MCRHSELEGPEVGSLLNVTAGLIASLRDDALMLEGPKFGEFGSLLKVTAGLIASLRDNALMLEGPKFGEYGSLLNVTAGQILPDTCDRCLEVPPREHLPTS